MDLAVIKPGGEAYVMVPCRSDGIPTLFAFYSSSITRGDQSLSEPRYILFQRKRNVVTLRITFQRELSVEKRTI